MTSYAADRRYDYATIAFLCAALLLGGASSVGYPGRLIVQLAALPLAWVAIMRLSASAMTPPVRAGLLLLGSILLLPVIQLIPLPADLWTAMPGRGPIVDLLAAMEVEPGMLGISLAPEATLTSWLALIPAAALFLAVLTLPEESRMRLCFAVIGIALVSVVVGTIQVSGRGQRLLYFYEITNVGSAVGFFSNRNHLATLLLAAIPLLSLLFRSAGRVALSRPAVVGRRVAAVSLASVLVIGILFTGSRAGLVLLVPVLALTYAATRRSSLGVPPVRLLLGIFATGIAVVAIVVYGPFYERIMQRSASLDDEARVWAAPVTADAGWQNFPFGTGFGTFDQVFRAAIGDRHLTASYVNHAHNDYLELWLTGGLPAMVLLIAVLIWGGRLAVTNWRLKPGNPSAISRAASIVVLVVLLHSIVDYPVRTVAISCLFALASALQLAPLLPRDRAMGEHPIAAPRRIESSRSSSSSRSRWTKR